MSTAFAIGAVSAVLRQLLDDGLRESQLSFLGSYAVTVLPPDLLVSSSDETPWLNLYLYQVTPNLGWRNVDLPARAPGGYRLSNPPLALDLHYLLSASSSKRACQAEILLGCGMQVLHEAACLSREYSASVLPPATANDSVNDALSRAGLAEQVEQIRIAPQTLSTEEISRLWTVFGAKHRPSAAYIVSVVLIEREEAARSPLPVLTIGKDNRGVKAQPSLVPPYPTIETIGLPDNRASALPGDTLTLFGHHYMEDSDGAPLAVSRMTAQLAHPRLPDVVEVDVPPAQFYNGQVQVTLPDSSAAFPAGVYTLSLVITPADPKLNPLTTNEVVLPVAPVITAAGGKALKDSPDSRKLQRSPIDPKTGLGDLAPLTLTCQAPVLPSQRAIVLLGAQSYPAAPPTADPNAVTCTATGLAAGTYHLRLRVDGVDSLLISLKDEGLPQFDQTQQVVLT